ncbi:RhoGAP-domain-containing protein [Lentinus brumalis]|uniref:RhoGAP-domain-containing protein n=1 Tax=Lentinus brumalis TaxID=2498619 RepID=A0A371D5W3_9APHY|nr:RhoGAP-domain-containing protein [Polyporus brumalis]
MVPYPRQSFFHVDCFRCAKCGNQVTADTNLLLLSDGSPICANCSYSCNVCKQPILDEAIMTGDDSYHAHCFKCKVCKNRIDELVFAKTSQGIYCMNCHNERVARSRRHQARKQERERERAAQAAAANAANGSMNSRPGDPRDGQNGRPTNGANNGQGRPGSQPDASSPDNSLYNGLSRSNSHRGPDSVDSHSSGPSSAGARRGSMHKLVTSEAQHRAQEQAAATPPSQPSPSSQGLLGSPVERPSVPLSKRHSGMFIGLPSSPSITRANTTAGRPSTAGSSAASSPIDHFRTTASPSSRMETLSVPKDGAGNGRLDKRKSFDNGIRPLNVLRSMTSSVSLNLNTNGTPTEYNRSLSNATPPVNTSVRGRDSPRSYSPLRDYFSPEPGAYTDSDYQSSPVSPPNGRGDSAAAGRARSASSGAYMTDAGSTRGTPQRPTLNLDRMPARSASLAIPTSFEALEAESPSNLVLHQSPPQSPEHRPSKLSLNGSNFHSERGAWDNVRHSALSGVEFELQRPGSGNSVPPSPSHFVDVPHSIESGTDTEAESDNGHGRHASEDSFDCPPSPPPKEPPPRQMSRRPNDLRVDVNQRSFTPANAGESEGTPESSPVERTSHATFIAPALPPIRISMGSADFSDLIRMAGQNSSSTGKLDSSKLKLDLALTPPDSAGAPTTPTSDITVLGSADNHATDDTPMRRGVTKADKNGATGPESTSSYDYGNGSRRSNDRERGRADPPTRSETPPLHIVRRLESNGSGRGTPVNGANGTARITVTAPGDGAETLRRKLQEAMSASSERGDGQVLLDASFVHSILGMLDQQQDDFSDLRRNLDGMKRASKQYIDGLTVAQTEYDRELKARRDAEAEVTRLRVLLSGQAVRLTAINGESKRQEAQKQLSREMNDQLSSLERDLSRLKVERDMTMAEVEQLSASRTSSTVTEGEDGGASLTRALSMRFDNIKVQYQHELIPLIEQREALIREITELQASRDAFLEETTVLNKRNEELAQLNAQYQRRLETGAALKDDNVLQERQSNSFDRARSPPMLNSSVSSTTLALSEESTETKFIKVSKPDLQDTPVQQVKPRFIKWPGSRAPKENIAVVNGSDPGKPKWRTEHVFQQVSVLRVARCDHCGDKMWGSQFRCNNCNVAVHTRCIHNVNLACQQQTAPARDETPMAPLPPSMFGRDLVEQVQADSREEDRMVPVIVEKCIDAVDRIALEYEGIYRKTGGSGHTKMITQLFERGEYEAFDLNDSDRFNDICSVTSVLKSYFRALPNPLLTYALHDKFIAASTIREPSIKHNTFNELVRELPAEHYYTLRALMLHLHRICERSELNLMHARNLGVVFGPTLMRSPDPGAEFSDMAGKALCIEYLVENAPHIFGGEQPPSE